MRTEFDLIVIGAGPGGYPAAIRAAQEGLRVALVENRDIGGTCLNRGCIPTKALIHASLLYSEMRDCEAFGLNAENVSYDIEKIYSRKADVVAQLRQGVEFLLDANKVEVIFGLAQVVAGGRVNVENGGETAELTAKNVLIATGSVPVSPPIEGIGLPDVLTSDELLQQNGTDYKSLVIIGGGVIGAEFATVFSALGCEVTIIEAMGRILPQMDRELSQNLGMLLKKRGVKIHTDSSVSCIEKDGGKLLCTFEAKGKQQSVSAQAVLCATGRRPNIEGLFAEGVAAEYDRGLVVNERFETSIKGVYAIGDVIKGSVQLAHAATAQGLFAVECMAGKKPETDLDVVPSCVYTNPEIACVGITEAEAKERGINVKIGKYSMAGNGRSVIEMQERGFIKLVFEAESERLLGAQLMCARATDIVSELAAAIAGGLTAGRLASVIRPHPTFAEGVTEAAEQALGRAIHAAPKKRDI